jgi:hypothetical protein
VRGFPSVAVRLPAGVCGGSPPSGVMEAPAAHLLPPPAWSVRVWDCMYHVEGDCEALALAKDREPLGSNGEGGLRGSSLERLLER